MTFYRNIFVSLLATCLLCACYSIQKYNNAVCYIEAPDGVVMSLTNDGHIQMPRTIIGVGEMGRTVIENAAYRDTGILLDVGEVIYDDKRNRHLYYRCTPIAPLQKKDYERLQPRPESQNFDVTVVNPHTMTNWKGETVELPLRFPKEELIMERHFQPNKTSRTKPAGFE